MSIEGNIIHADTENTLLLRFTPDGARLVGVDSAARILVWTVGGGPGADLAHEHPSGLTYVYGLAVAGSELLATVGQGPIRIWRLPGVELYREIRGSDAIVQTAAFSPDGSLLLTADDHEVLRALSVDSLALRHEERAAERNSSIVFHPDGETLAVTCSWQNGSRVRFFRLSEALAPLEERAVRRTFDSLGPLAFSPDGKVFAFSDGYVNVYTFPDNRWCYSFDANGERLERETDGTLVTSFWSDLVFTPDGRLLAAGSPNGEVFLWSVADGRLRHILRGHQGSVFSLALAPGAKTLATSGEDGTVRLWQLGSL